MTSDVTIARASGVKLVERDGKILVVEIGTNWAYIMGFVVGLISFILGVFGTLQLVLALSGGSGILLLGIIFTTLSIVGFVGLSLLVKHVRSRNDAPPETLPILCIFDLPGGNLCDRNGQPIATLATTRLRRKFQIGSSSPALEVNYGHGSLLLAKGNPFAGGIAPLEEGLQHKGIVSS